MFCATCGQSLSEGAKFCAHCGAPVGSDGGAPRKAAEPDRPASSAPPPPPAYGAAEPDRPASSAPPPPPAYGAAEPDRPASSAPPPPPAYGAAASGASQPAPAPATDTLIGRLVERVKAILITPRTEWPVIAAEPASAQAIYLHYVAPLVAVGAIASFIGMTVVGIPLPLLGTVRIGFGAGLTGAILHFVLTFVGVFVCALIVDALAPTFGGEKNSLRALKVTAYSFTPAWVAAILTIFPPLDVLAGLIGLYGLYLLYVGLPVLMRAPADKSLGYTVVVVICAIVVSIVVSVASSIVIGALGGHAASALGAGGSADATVAADVLAKALGGKTEADRTRMQEALATLQKMGEDADRAQRTARASGADPGAAAAGAVDADKALAAVGQMIAGGKAVEPVDFRALKALLPEALPGMTRTHAGGERGEAMGIKGSNASASYEDGRNGRITLEIADLGSLSGLASLATRFDPALEKESDTGYERTRKVDGRLVHEKFDRRAKGGETSVVVDNRFTVTARGSGIDEAALGAAVKSVDLVRLAKLATK